MLVVFFFFGNTLTSSCLGLCHIMMQPIINLWPSNQMLQLNILTNQTIGLSDKLACTWFWNIIDLVGLSLICRFKIWTPTLYAMPKYHQSRKEKKEKIQQTSNFKNGNIVPWEQTYDMYVMSLLWSLCCKYVRNIWWNLNLFQFETNLLSQSKIKPNFISLFLMVIIYFKIYIYFLCLKFIQIDKGHMINAVNTQILETSTST
jgi:hypothetical protein